MFPFPGPHWDGYLKSEPLNEQARSYRQNVFRAAEAYEWDHLISLLAEREKERNVNFVKPDDSSLYTPLHHAAHRNAPEEVVEKLLALGLFRSMRCVNGERPVDIAKRLGHSRLVPLLEPVEPEIAVPTETLSALEDKFHQLLLYANMSPITEMRLPTLEVLMEQKEQTMVFLVPFGTNVYKLQQLSFPIAVEMDKKEWVLLVRHMARMGGGIETHYFVTTHGAQIVSQVDYDA